MTDESKEARHNRAIHLLRQLEGYEGSELARARKSAWDYYLQRPRGDEVEGRSRVVTGEVSAMVESTLAQVVEAISTDDLAEFGARGEADEAQAKLEGEVVSQLIMQGPGWFRMAAATKNALLLRQGITSPAIIEKEFRNVVTVEKVDAVAHAVMVDSGVTFIEYDPDTQVGKIEQVETRQEVSVRNVNPENFLYVQWPLDDFENIPACAERFITTRQQLIDDEGISAERVDKIKATAQPEKSDATVHRPGGFTAHLPAVSQRQQLVEWFALYYLHDGVRYRAVVADCEVLAEEVVSRRPPYCIGVAFINPGHLEGFSIYDKLKITQDITTALTRMLNDNSNAVTMNRLAVLKGSCSADQLTDQDPSGVLQFERSKVGGDVRNGVFPIQTQDLTAGLVTSLQYQRQVRSEMAGASLDVGTGNVQLPDRMGSMGLDRAYSASEQLSALILQTFAQTLIKDLWLQVHELLRNEWVGPLSVKLSGRWVEVEPAKWPRRYSVRVKPGMSPGERQRKSQALGAFIQLQMQLAERGMEGILVDAERFYRAVCDWGRLNDIPSPEHYLADPTTPAAVEAFQRKAQQAAQQQAAQQRLQEMAIALEQMEKAVTKYGIDVKAAVEKYRIDSQSEAKEAELTVSLVQERERAERELAQQQAQAGKQEAGKE